MSNTLTITEPVVYNSKQLNVLREIVLKLKKEDPSQTNIDFGDKEQVSKMLKNYSKECHCPICLEGVLEEGGNRILACKHFIHDNCLDQLTEIHGKNTKCPICVQPVFPKKENNKKQEQKLGTVFFTSSFFLITGTCIAYIVNTLNQPNLVTEIVNSSTSSQIVESCANLSLDIDYKSFTDCIKLDGFSGNCYSTFL
ncbi:RING-finger domain-containing protein [Naegleria gruberi]|uniref:RING-finger domain-containing protein n=1 Tax=Naegleria gruberi TaxID=5762 RepID=D2VWA4_NAEGR|nr:RING-finger domain-containing protein [Naegleria gruberi]EFC38797.1 RING-finger domain-containing protein [Naegleria gruberi]|eukprot:XP_002671541.1 RING-finger domain-containing protein [Naegleria gruberi strain NEG-M]